MTFTNSLVSTTLTPGPPTLGPWMRKILVWKGLPMIVWGIAGSPMKPAGGNGAEAGSHVRNGPAAMVGRTLAKSQGRGVPRGHPSSMVKLIDPAASATNDFTPNGAVTVYVAPGTRPLGTTLTR